MEDGSKKSRLMSGETMKELQHASTLTRVIGLLVIVFLALSFYIPTLLAIVGSFIVASVAMFTYDLNRVKEKINYDVKKAESINEFQNTLISIIHELAGIRVNYERNFDYSKCEHEKYSRFLKVPYIVIIPKIKVTELKRNLSTLSFTAKLISEDEAKSIYKKEIAVRSRSLTVLSYHLSTIESLAEMWRIRNDLYQQCFTSPSQSDPNGIEPDLSTVKEVQRFANYAALTDQCMVLTDLVLEHSQAALEYFIPAAASLLKSEAKSLCPIPQISDKVFNTQHLFRSLEGEEKVKLESMVRDIIKQRGLND
ncbi:hypothetical protein [Pseudidiomarina insulisalsae]|uniref:Uncharacterized protein n=1 Tax=Pseudidiomarina insulisalsae TaxID=575789 RepID=A0A432YI45_9GAMM|nr:hypothetical protein [Pseudidiomarina insulisalsae]RUO60637.1 hypothetical protein CWI71_07200 [Pseudidiomarina insulisalsae]